MVLSSTQVRKINIITWHVKANWKRAKGPCFFCTLMSASEAPLIQGIISFPDSYCDVTQRRNSHQHQEGPKHPKALLLHQHHHLAQPVHFSLSPTFWFLSVELGSHWGDISYLLTKCCWWTSSSLAQLGPVTADIHHRLSLSLLQSLSLKDSREGSSLSMVVIRIEILLKIQCKYTFSLKRNIFS